MTWQRAVLVALAILGGILLAVIIGTYWTGPGDNYAYWLAGERIVAGAPIYTAGESAFEPYAYHYLPPLAQALAPLTLVVPATAYLFAFRVLELLALWDLAGRRMLAMLALIAFLPVAVELRFDNVHLLMAIGIVLGLGRWSWLFAIGAVIKISPGLGIVYLALRRRWRDVVISSIVGVAIVAVSFVLDPGLWRAWLDTVVGRAGTTGNSLIPVPYIVRAIVGLGLTVAGGLLGRRRGELLLVGGITIANPNLALNGFAVLAAAVPIWFAGPGGIGEGYERGSADAETRSPESLPVTDAAG